MRAQDRKRRHRRIKKRHRFERSAATSQLSLVTFLTPLAAKKKQEKFKCHFSKDNLLKLPKNFFSENFKLKSLPTKKNKRISP